MADRLDGESAARPSDVLAVAAALRWDRPDLTAERLGEVIGELIGDRARLLKMAEAARGSRIVDAAARLADLCLAAGAQA